VYLKQNKEKGEIETKITKSQATLVLLDKYQFFNLNKERRERKIWSCNFFVHFVDSITSTWTGDHLEPIKSDFFISMLALFKKYFSRANYNKLAPSSAGWMKNESSSYGKMKIEFSFSGWTKIEFLSLGWESSIYLVGENWTFTYKWQTNLHMRSMDKTQFSSTIGRKFNFHDTKEKKRC